MTLRKHQLAKTTVQRFTQKHYNAKLILLFIVWHFLYQKIALTFSFTGNNLIKFTVFEKRRFYHTKFHLKRFTILQQYNKWRLGKDNQLQPTLYSVIYVGIIANWCHVKGDPVTQLFDSPSWIQWPVTIFGKGMNRDEITSWCGWPTLPHLRGHGPWPMALCIIMI